MAAVNSWSLLSRLKRAVKKVKILLNLDINRWRLVASLMSASPSSRATSSRRLSFNERPGLRACVNDTESEDYHYYSITSSSSSPALELRRTSSSCLSEDDIDNRAELFIQNFRRQLQIERQISLELKYNNSQGNNGNNNSFKLISP
ncbi:uncharacterized protein LOC107262373 [Ricinus communis]|uniref:uncharacterized protein LOC107262373 n=1 Tax=Ricinus communis TaxID=3988 RepID=UPI0007723424|nr:uncharacterized protein LOC107262373 [Ricinus communis]|eukprot:XP_015583284.1 uncharacterized protein LOC107262373 [Ricinus communis]